MTAKSLSCGSFSCVVLVVLLGGSAQGGAGPITYWEDFSTDPGWTTNAPSLFHWNPATETYAAAQVNINGGGNYACYDLRHDGGSFHMEWDIIVHRVDYASGLTFGMFDTDLDTQSPCYATVNFTRADQGKFVFMAVHDCQGNISYTKTPADQFSLGTWYHVAVQYEDTAGTMTAEITEGKGGGGPHFTSLWLSGIGGLCPDVGNIGSSNVRTGSFQVPGAMTLGEFDNVSFIPEPAALGLLGVGGLALVRRRRSM